MEMIQEELDRQAGELARIARGLDGATGPDGRAELQVGQLLQHSQERLYAEWPEDMPSAWLDERAKTITRVGAHRESLLWLAAAFDRTLQGDLNGKAEQMLAAARDATPTAIAARFYEAPLVYLPDAMERDLTDLVFETHRAILLLLEDALGELEAKKAAGA